MYTSLDVRRRYSNHRGRRRALRLRARGQRPRRVSLHRPASRASRRAAAPVKDSRGRPRRSRVAVSHRGRAGVGRRPR